ncbi:BgTH12-06009 [Blumeria graminis f. sp. triticale]|uniref:Bgt-670 n=3 Tax=Blumeria graminis TaxID=34373 RepID=A0A381LD97_BLUGR|nr:Subunit of the heme-activated glucose-repressed Hap2p-3p-4p-5p CCAAT-binding complex [Blumeria graminis f. sp. tritici 96224]CAD6504276.1 BgTH12-06009 [Blumeria graminis f. sp. triticale]VDB91082.1 Bgt-670 [Blumeria graminis f. sp. tritici]
MSASPPKDDVEQAAQSPDDPDAQMNQDPHSLGLAYEFEVKEQDRWLPIANVQRSIYECTTVVVHPAMSSVSCSQSPEPQRSSKPRKHEHPDSQIHNTAPVARIMKMALPENAKIAKEAKECMQECVSEFISFITSEEKCHQEKRKTVNGEDILFAMTSLGFENYAEALKIYLSKYRETQSTRGENRPGSQGFGSTAASGSGGSGNATSGFPGSEGANKLLGSAERHDDSEHASGYPILYGNQSTAHNGTAERDNY